MTPRTLQSAFGPYATGPLHPMPPSATERLAHRCDLLVLAIAAVSAIGAFFGVI
jgi:hypothetical protein